MLTKFISRRVRKAGAAEDHPRGQVVVIVAAGLVVLVAMVGLVIDGGLAWGRQRDTQNVADAAAKAGAAVMAERVAGVSPTPTDADVRAAVDATVAANGLASPDAYYTNINGAMLTSGGAVTTSDSAAAEVGGGFIPAGAAGVRARTSQTFDTALARVIGVNSFTAEAGAIAVAGYLTGTCDADAGCMVLPVTFPVTVLGCDGSGNPAPVTDSTGNKILWSVTGEYLTIPLCKNGPGNVGWLDWNPNEQTEGCTGTGTAEVACVIENPQNPYLSWPGWYQVASTGNPNSGQIQTALDAYDGQTVLIPQFDVTCDDTPSGPGVEDCPAGHVGGNGSQQWYHLAGMSAFELCASTTPECAANGWMHGSYVQGSSPQCDTGNGGTSCLAGRFIDLSYEGEVQANPGANAGTAVVGIQLIE
jgi:Flp pilus assembly protein TadG